MYIPHKKIVVHIKAEVIYSWIQLIQNVSVTSLEQFCATNVFVKSLALSICLLNKIQSRYVFKPIVGNSGFRI